MSRQPLLFTALTLALVLRCAPTLADDHPPRPASAGVHEVPDPELATLRGRYILSDNSVAWFGVQMISTWQSSNGQLLQSSMNLDMDFRNNPNQPQVTFVPTVTITTTAAPLPASATSPSRSINSAGLMNVAGVMQGVQIGGDNNSASNVTRLNVQDGGTIPTATGSGTDSTLTVGDATATASYDGGTARVLLSISGQGAVQQWISQGSLGQSIALTADNQSASNQMEITLIRQSLATNIQLAQNLAQSLNLVRGIGH